MANVTSKQVAAVGKVLAGGSGEISGSQNITVEKLKKFLPKGSAHQVTENLVKMIHDMEDDTGLEQGYMEERFMANINVVKNLKISMEEYLNAVKYCMLKQNMSNRKAWEITFPDKLLRAERKLQERILEGRGDSVNIDSHVSNYNMSAAVVAIDTDIAIGFDIQYAPARHMALKKLIDMTQGKCAPDAHGNPMTVTPHVQYLCAKELMDALKPEVDKTVNIKLGMSDEAMAAQQTLADQLGLMAKAQMAQLKSGKDINEVQKLGIEFATDVEIVEG